MTSLADAWPVLTGPRVEDSWVEVIHATAGVPRINLIPAAASFEDGTMGGWGVGWLGSPGAVALLNSTTRAYGKGARSMRITYPNNAAGSGPQYVFTTTPGVRYTAQVPAWVPAASPAVRFDDPFGNTSTTVSTVKDEWQVLSITFTAPGTNVYFTLRSTAATTGVEQVWVDKLRVFVGDGTAPEFSTESVTGRLDGVTGCRVEHNVNAQIRGGCSLSLRDVGQELDWASVRFRPWVRVNNLTWPLGVFLPASPSLSHDEFGSAWDVPCLDKTSILDQDVMTTSYSVPAGAVVTDQVAELIAGAREASTASAPSTLTTRPPQTWEPGTSRLRIINDLLDGINYFSLWADRHGLFRAEPYRRPQDRSLAATFAAGEAAIHSPRWSRAQDIAGAPTRTVVIVEGDEETPGMTATADNTDPASPYSIPSRGRVVARTYTGVEAADQPTLDALAARYLADASTPSATLEVQHASVPLDGNDVVRFASAGVDTLAVVEGWQVDLTPGSLMTGTWREGVSS